MTIFYNRSKTDRQKGRTAIKKSLYNLLLTLPIIGIVLLSGCEEDPSQIGSGILPGSDLNYLHSTDTFGIESYTSYEDRVKTFYVDSNGTTIKPGTYYLGTDYSPYFGLTSAGFVTQLWLDDEWGRNHLTLDSAILNLHITGVNGELPMGQEVNIYEVDEVLSKDSVYYISKDIQIKQPLGSFSLAGATDADTVLKLHMPMIMVNELMRDTTMLYLAEDSIDFRNYFKGLYFEYPQAGNNHMVKVNLNNGYSSLTVYYTDTTFSKNQYTFLFNTKTVSFNVFEHDFSAAEPGKEIQHINEEIQDTVSYIQGYSGVYTTLRIPSLEALRDSVAIYGPVFGINKARLYLPVYSNETDFLEDDFPTSLIAMYRNEEGNRYTTRDFLLDPYFADGQYYSLDDYYIINITGFAQDYIEQDDRPEITIPEPEVEILFGSYEGNHLIMLSKDSSNPPILELVYTKKQ